jgi:hypothetical protein
MDFYLKSFLEHNKNDIVNFVEGNQQPIPVTDNIFGKMMNKLVEYIPVEKDGKVGLDKAPHRAGRCSSRIYVVWMAFPGQWLVRSK